MEKMNTIGNDMRYVNGNVCFLSINRDLMYRIVDDGERLIEVEKAPVPTPCMCSAVTSAIGSEVKELIKKCVDEKGEPGKEDLRDCFRGHSWFSDRTEVL